MNQPKSNGEAAPVPNDIQTQIAEMQKELHVRYCMILDKDEAIATLQKQVGDQAVVLESRAEHIRQLEAARAELTEIQAKQAAWIKELEAFVGGKEAHIEELTGRLARSEETNQKLSTELSALRQRIMNIESSAFWQRTAALHKDL